MAKRVKQGNKIILKHSVTGQTLRTFSGKNAAKRAREAKRGMEANARQKAKRGNRHG